jgi:K+ transporter
MNFAPLINAAFNYVIKTSELYNIDESHALKHSMEVFNYANKLYNVESVNNEFLHNQKDIIISSAILHDMCDKKYISECSGIMRMKYHMSEYIPSNKLKIVEQIISTMSYSKVKQFGFPNLGEYQLAYNIVRESDLLAGYDLDRCIMYGMYMEKLSYTDAIKRALELFEHRVLKYNEDKLFTIYESKHISFILHSKLIKDIENYKIFL